MIFFLPISMLFLFRNINFKILQVAALHARAQVNIDARSKLQRGVTANCLRKHLYCLSSTAAVLYYRYGRINISFFKAE